jgi:hypothetical protein
MDLGAGAEGIAQAVLAVLLIVSLAIHSLAAVVSSVGLAAGGRAARVLSLSALAVVTANHIGLVYLGAWHGVVLDSPVIWPVIFTALAGYIGGIAIRSIRQRTAAGNPARRDDHAK